MSLSDRDRGRCEKNGTDAAKRAPCYSRRIPVEHSYQPIRPAVLLALPPPQTIVDQSAVDAIENAGADGLVALSFRLSAMPRWDIPPIPSRDLSTEEYEQLLETRELALDARRATALSLATDLVSDIESAGGALSSVSWRTGWVHAEIPSSAAEEFLERPDPTPHGFLRPPTAG